MCAAIGGGRGIAGELLRRHRIRAGLTQEELAARTGLGLRTLRDLEHGRVRRPRDRSVAILASVLDLTDIELSELRAALAEVGTDLWPCIGVLGPLAIRRGGMRVDVGPPMRRRLLGLLALQPGRAVPREEIIDVLWGHEPPSTCWSLVHMHVAKLRSALDPARVRRSPSHTITLAGGGYLLVDEHVEVDLTQFDRIAARARDARRTGDVVMALELYDEALRCWRGPVLADADARLRHHALAVAAARRRISATLAHADAAIELGRPDRAAMWLQTLTPEEPLHEGLHARLIVALAGSGERAAALRLFADVRNRLRDELGTEPGAELQTAHLRVLRHEVGSVARPSDDGGVEVVARPEHVGRVAHPVRPAQLPADPVSFTGRREQLRLLNALLPSRGAARTNTILILGTAGVGKTALAVHWAHRVADRFTDGQLHVNLRGFDPAMNPMSPGEALRLVLDALDVPPQRIPVDLDARIGLFRSLVAGRRLLILIDNAHDPDQVRPLLPGSRQCLAIVTSRLELSGLIAEGGYPLTLDPLSTTEARALLRRRLGAGRIAAEPQSVDELIARCARLPLALSVMAARAAGHPNRPLADLARQLGEAQGLGALDGEDASTDVRAVLSWSYLALSRAAARLFRLLGLHPGPDVGTPAAASLAGIPIGQVRALLAELTSRHLLTESSPGRFTFHDLLRAYATELAHRDPDSERRSATQRILNHYLQTGHAAALLLEPHRVPLAPAPAQPGVAAEVLGDHQQALAWFAVNHAVLLAIVALAVASGFDDYVGQLAWTLTDFLQRQSHWQNQATVHLAALGAAVRLADRPGQARAHRHLGRAHTLLGDHDEAHVHYRQALGLSEELGDRTGLGHTHINLANLLERQGHHREALEHSRRALELFQAIDNRDAQARCLNMVGWYYAQLGDYQRATANCDQALSLLRELGDRVGQANTIHSLGYAHHHLGQHPRAIAHYRQAAAMFAELGDHYAEAEALSDLGETHRSAGDPQAARTAWQRAKAILDQINHPAAAQVHARLRDLDRSPTPGRPTDGGSAC